MSATATQGQAERAELEAILNSRIFNRAPSLALFLQYVCRCHFEGRAEDLKEYSIAVEALGRAPDFDQKKDSIVRVEAHRLRKRLADYYRTAGSDHAIQIEIPNGQYAPRFISRDEIAETQPSELTSGLGSEPGIAPLASSEWAPEAEVAVQHPAPLVPQWIVRGAMVGGLTLAAAALFWAALKDRPNVGPEVWHGSATGPVPGEFRILAGYHGAPFTDRQGRTWEPDAYFNGGRSVALPSDLFLEGLPDHGFARSRREGDFQYSIPERQGTYEVHLYFASTGSSDPDDASVQLFSVRINGKLALDHFDLLSDAGGPNRLTSRVFRDVTPAQDGQIHLKFEQQGRKPVLMAMEILCSKSGTVRPVRIVAAKHSVTDSDGSLWTADEYAVGGMLVERVSSILDSDLKPLYAGEHFGNFTYQIPVPPGRYRVRLFFAETFFGSKLPFAGTEKGPGARVFNVFTEGATLLKNFDVLKEAGGPNRAVVRVFNNLEPNAQGKIILEFEPVQNYAEVNAIEVAQMGTEKQLAVN